MRRACCAANSRVRWSSSSKSSRMANDGADMGERLRMVEKKLFRRQVAAPVDPLNSLAIQTQDAVKAAQLQSFHARVLLCQVLQDLPVQANFMVQHPDE